MRVILFALQFLCVCGSFSTAAKNGDEYLQGVLIGADKAQFEAIVNDETIPRAEKLAKLGALFAGQTQQNAFNSFIASENAKNAARRHFEEQRLAMVSQPVQQAWHKLQQIEDDMALSDQEEENQKNMLLASLTPVQRVELDAIDDLGEMGVMNAQLFGPSATTVVPLWEPLWQASTAWNASTAGSTTMAALPTTTSSPSTVSTILMAEETLYGVPVLPEYDSWTSPSSLLPVSFHLILVGTYVYLL